MKIKAPVVAVASSLVICLTTNLAAQQLTTGDPNPKIMERLGPNISRVRPTNTPYEKWFARARQRYTDF